MKLHVPRYTLSPSTSQDAEQSFPEERPHVQEAWNRVLAHVRTQLLGWETDWNRADLTSYNNPALAKTILNGGGFNWTLIDAEHGQITDADYFTVSVAVSNAWHNVLTHFS